MEASMEGRIIAIVLPTIALLIVLAALVARRRGYLGRSGAVGVTVVSVAVIGVALLWRFWGA